MSAKSHHHGEPSGGYGRAFALGIGLNLAFVVAEVMFGLRARSLALLSDAGHNLGDVLGLVMAWGAMLLARRLPTLRRTYGLRRSTILAALVNAVVLLVAVGGLAWEAVRRFADPAPVLGGTVIVVALVGVGINTVSALLFMSGRRADLNIRAAFVHLLADAAVSLGVALAGLAMLRTGWLWIDPVVSLGIGAVIALGTWGILRESANLALDAVPEGIDADGVSSFLAGLEGVSAVHDLHVWAMSTSETALTVHLVVPQRTLDDDAIAGIGRELHTRFGIEHSTIQIERGDGAEMCTQAPTEVV